MLGWGKKIQFSPDKSGDFSFALTPDFPETVTTPKIDGNSHFQLELAHDYLITTKTALVYTQRK